MLAEVKAGPSGALRQKIPLTPTAVAWLSRQSRGAEGGGQPAAIPSKVKGDKGKAKEFDGVLFKKGKGDPNAVAMNDVRQGALGNCYFVALLAAIAKVRPDVIRDMVVNNGNGTFTVTFDNSELFGKAAKGKVTVDDEFWAQGGKPIYANTGDASSKGPELWVMVIEKAWAKLHGGYGKTTGGNIGSVDVGEALTGEPTKYITPSAMSKKSLLKQLKKHFKKNDKPVVFWTITNSKKIDDDLVANHAYALRGVNVEDGTVTLYNPWGHHHPGPLDMAHVQANFSTILLVDVESK